MAYDHQVNANARRETTQKMKAELKGEKSPDHSNSPQRLFIVGQDFVFDLRPPNKPKRLGGHKKLGITFNAASAYPEGGALIVGTKGSIVFIP